MVRIRLIKKQHLGPATALVFRCAIAVPNSDKPLNPHWNES